MLLRVEYQNEKYDYVSAAALEELITFLGIKQFYRPSEKRWIDVVQGPIRASATDYMGPERRLTQGTA